MESNYISILKCYKFAELLYEKAYSYIDLFLLIRKKISDKKKFIYLMHFDKIRREFRSEKLLLFYIEFGLFL